MKKEILKKLIEKFTANNTNPSLGLSEYISSLSDSYYSCNLCGKELY